MSWVVARFHRRYTEHSMGKVECIPDAQFCVRSSTVRLRGMKRRAADVVTTPEFDPKRTSLARFIQHRNSQIQYIHTRATASMHARAYSLICGARCCVRRRAAAPETSRAVDGVRAIAPRTRPRASRRRCRERDARAVAAEPHGARGAASELAGARRSHGRLAARRRA